MAAHRPVQPSLPHWLAHSSTVPAGILAPVATRFTAQSLRALPLSAPASRFLHQRGVQLTQAATCSAGSCDSAHEVGGGLVDRETCESLQSTVSSGYSGAAWQGAAVRALELLAAMGLAALVTASSAFAQASPLLPALPVLERRSGTEVASATEDRLLMMLKQVEARVGAAVGALSDARPIQDEAAAAAEAAEARELVEEVRAVVAENYLDARGGGWDAAAWDGACQRVLAGPLRDRAAAHRAIRELLAAGLDPFTRFITPDEFLAMRKYDVTGVGLNLAPAEEYERKGGVWVIGMIRGTAAARAGVEQGDQLLAVDGAALDGATPFQAANLLMGAAEDGAAAVPSVTVRHYNGSTEDIRMQRPVRTLESPVAFSLDERDRGKVGVIRLAAFNSRAVPDVAAAVRRLAAAGAAEFVLDLRDNRGGLVQEGVELARLFLDGGSTVVVTAGRGAGEAAVRATGAPLTRAPLTLLVNEWSASASEIFAGALHDNCRAVLVGNRTYGKGLIQSVYELGDASGLVLTVGKYLTPARTDIDREGIAPDFRHTPSAPAAAARLAACRAPGRA